MHDSPSILEDLLSNPIRAFDLARAKRELPAIHPPTITRVRARRSHTGLDGIRRSIGPDLVFVGEVVRPTDRIRRWAVLVDVLGLGPLDPDRIWTWAFTHASLRHELAVVTLHLVITECHAPQTILAAFGCESELAPLVVYA